MKKAHRYNKITTQFQKNISVCFKLVIKSFYKSIAPFIIFILIRIELEYKVLEIRKLLSKYFTKT